MFKAKTKMIERDSEAFASEVFVVADNITPIAIASVDGILKLDDVENLEVVPEKKVKQLIIENKSTNPMSKFFVRLGTYLDSMENFLIEMQSNYSKAVEQKRSLHGLETSDQKQKTSRAKRTARKLAVNKLSNSFNPTTGGGLLTDNILGLMVANFLAKGFENRISNQAESIVIVPYKPVAGQLKAKGETKGSNVSGYELTSAYGHRWGRMHGGVDIGVPIGTMFALKKKAIIKYVGYQDANDPSVGYGLLLDAWVPSLNKMFRFGHLSEVAVKDGDTVDAGQVLGKSGNTGRSTGPHFHIEVHPEVRPDYGGENPMPYIDYVIAGDAVEDDAVEQRSEGSIERIGRVMVGEAGTEFVIPMSQMPIFAQLMMEEKIKSLNPLYNPPYGRYDNLGVERQSGFSQNMMASGGISGAIQFIKKHEGLGAFVPGTGGGNFLADYIGDGMSYSVKGTERSVAYNPSTKLFSYIDTEGVDTLGYGTTFYDDIFGGDQPVKRGDTSTVGKMEDIMNKHVRQIYDQYDEWYPLFKYFKPNQQAGIISYLYNRGPNAIVGYGPMRRAIKAGNLHELAHEIEIDIKSVGPKRRKEEADLLRTGPSKILGPKIVGPKEVGPGKVGSGLPLLPDLTIDKFLNPGKYGDQSSLNNIPGNEQMQVANETEEQFSFGDVRGEIVAFYQPTVYYTES